eukprot:scaffold9989_cov141-Skeletonema_marinoi.AAC.4
MHQNVGKGGAVKSGMLASKGQLCLMVDADGATDITDGLPKLLKEMYTLNDNKERHDTRLPPKSVVFGSRAHLENESSASRSKVRTFLMHAFHFFVKALCSPRIKDTQCGFKLFTRSAAISLFTNLHLRRWAFDTELVVIAERLQVSVSEVGVIWHEIDGSKLDGGKLSLALVSLEFGRCTVNDNNKAVPAKNDKHNNEVNNEDTSIFFSNKYLFCTMASVCARAMTGTRYADFLYYSDR